MWRGIAAYRALDFLTAAQEFRKVETVEGRFALGNAEAQNHAWEKSIKAYDEVLKTQPGHLAAKDQSRDRRRTFRGAGGKTPQAGAGRQRAAGPEGG